MIRILSLLFSLTIALFCTIGAAVHAQETVVEGRVLKLGRVPMPYAHVQYRHLGTGTTYTTQADENGRYSIRSLVIHAHDIKQTSNDSNYEVTLFPDSNGTRFFKRIFVRSVRDTVIICIDTVMAPPPRTILFIGNSYTFYNGGIDTHLHNLCLTADSTNAPFTTSITGPGYSLRNHWETATTRQAIRNNHYDLVILQEQSTNPITDSLSMFQYADSLTRIIREAGSEAAFFMTWTHRSDTSKTHVLASSYHHCGTVFGVTVVPVGWAWLMSLRRNPEIVLHQSDKSHPTTCGTYLAVCTFYAALFGRGPVGLTYVNDPSIGPEQRAVLQQTAWDAVQQHRP